MQAWQIVGGCQAVTSPRPSNTRPRGATAQLGAKKSCEICRSQLKSATISRTPAKHAGLIVAVSTPENGNNGTAAYFIPRCQTLRELKGKSMNDLAKAADVDRSRVTLIERKQPVTGLVAAKVFQALNQWHADALSYEAEVTKTPTIKKR